ncbi:hypothetical protein [Qiania dongpingensis]|uniref:Uncharacterized protein n=1 Tax=Qiania dongpingensis TaxID=2763669 RepID=A0A7G9G0M2_9FIRM|nr:hypothetical protein [Qiania dongpingensis]QNM04354.1 hypothetical protein H9Q78_07575 [Qiania dongpingensis]
MAERYSDFIWDYYGGRPFRRTYPGGLMRPVSWMRAADLEYGNSQTAQMNGSMADGQDIGRDMEYFQAMYPEKMKKIQGSINDLCDTIDYEGSILYDEYPDRVGLRRLCDEVYQKELPEEASDVEAEWLKDAIEVLLYHEVCRRRIRRSSSRKKYW